MLIVINSYSYSYSSFSIFCGFCFTSFDANPILFEQMSKSMFTGYKIKLLDYIFYLGLFLMFYYAYKTIQCNLISLIKCSNVDIGFWQLCMKPWKKYCSTFLNTYTISFDLPIFMKKNVFYT